MRTACLPVDDGRVLTPSDLRSQFPWVPLGHWPTPLEPCDRLRDAIGGPRVWLKRDDCSGLAGGGNKTRKLEYLIGAALAEEASGVITFGALQSNHARQTAAACAKYGLTCDLVLTRAVARSDEHYLHSGNVLLDGLLGATVHVVDDSDAAFACFAQLFDAATAEGRHLYGILPGGSTPVGALGYVDGALELAGQVAAAGLSLESISVAASTAGTAAGLIVGSAAAALDTTVDIACVYQSAAGTEAELRPLLAGVAAMVSVDPPADDRWRISDAALGDGYGIPTPEAMSAIDVLARTEGVLLDPVYTSKAFARLVAQIQAGALPADRDVVFVHTGGAPGLFAYAPAFA